MSDRTIPLLVLTDILNNSDGYSLISQVSTLKYIKEEHPKHKSLSRSFMIFPLDGISKKCISCIL
jgi:hypothetical protein